jgi:hypothetical protein
MHALTVIQFVWCKTHAFTIDGEASCGKRTLLER